MIPIPVDRAMLVDITDGTFKMKYEVEELEVHMIPPHTTSQNEMVNLRFNSEPKSLESLEREFRKAQGATT